VTLSSSSFGAALLGSALGLSYAYSAVLDGLMARAPKTNSVVKRRATLGLREPRARVALVADTHSAPHPRATELLRSLHPDAILHAGDIGAIGVLDDLAQIAPTLAVRGNIDGRTNGLPDELTIDVRDEAHAESLFKIFLVHIAVYGPKLRADVARRARAEGASLVVCATLTSPS
jgi:hypothetical protein